MLVTLKDDVDIPEKWPDFAVKEPEASTLLQFLDTMEFRTLARRVREHFAREKGAEIVAAYAAPTPVAAEPQPGARAAEPVDGVFKREAYECVRDLAALERWIARAREAGVVGIDTEASSFDASHAELVGLSLAIGSNDACYIPLAHQSADTRAGELFASEAPIADAAPDAGAQIPLADALKALKPLLEDVSVLKVGLNIKFDIALFARLGVALAPIDDPMLMSFALYGGLNEHGKAELVEQHLGHGLMPLSDIAGKGKSQVSFDFVPVERATTFSCGTRGRERSGSGASSNPSSRSSGSSPRTKR